MPQLKKKYNALIKLVNAFAVHLFKLSTMDDKTLDQGTFEKSLLPIVIYATLSREAWDGRTLSVQYIRTNIVPAYIMGLQLRGANYQALANCFASDASSESRTGLAVKTNIVPPYDQWIAFVRKLNQSELRAARHEMSSAT